VSDAAAEDLLALAMRAAAEAGGVLLERFGGPSSGVDTKSTRTDLVSDADRAAERAIVQTISTARPDDAILAEESGRRDGASPVRWVVDPLDGTTNYLWGLPQWSVSIAAFDEHGPAAGVVFDPPRDEMFAAARGSGARDARGALRVRSGAQLAEALVGTGFNYSSAERARQADRLAAILPEVRDIRRHGSAALDLAWVAAGRLDAFFETGLERWDYAAGALLVTEAGGEVRVLPPRDGSPECVVAGPPPLMASLISLIEGSYE
jgi:myo-inositol-1(or 4)-monophosphatase